MLKKASCPWKKRFHREANGKEPRVRKRKAIFHGFSRELDGLNVALELLCRHRDVEADDDEGRF